MDRYETSILLAQRLTSDSLILANGDDFPDALSAASFAGIKQIPIVLTSKKLPDSVIQYYKETQPKHLIVIGGEVVIPSDELTKNKFNIETRLGGQDRYETNAKVISFMKATYESNDLFLASGLTFPDAVAGTVLASKLKAPLLLTEKADIPPSVYGLMREHMKIEPPTKGTEDSVGTEEKAGKKAKQGKVTASGGLNLRDTSSSMGKTLLTIPQGTMLDLTDQQDHWYKTTYQSKTGWISADYVTVTASKQPLKDTSNTKTPTVDLSKNQPQTGKVTALGGLNLRDTSSQTGKTLLTIPHSTMLDLTDQQDNWYKTTYQSKSGWISADYVTIVAMNQPASDSSNTTPTNNVDTTTTLDLSVNGTIYILGGSSVISSNTQNIIEGKASSKYKDNLKDFPPLPSEIKKPAPPSRGGDVIPSPTNTPSTNTPLPIATDYDPSKEVLVKPSPGILANALSGKTILVDPGHGGKDPGAIGPNHTYEKNNTLAIALALNDVLKQAGAKVILTRDEDISPAANYSEIEDLQARVNLANKSNVDLFISIHNDANTKPDIQGTSVYFSKDNPKQNESLQLANSIQFAVTDTVKTNNLGIREAGFYVLRNTKMPSILLEVAYISNLYEEARLRNPTFQKNLATAIFQGIYNYFINPLPKY